MLGISVVSYNFERYLPDLFESLLNQTFKDFEIWISDDASTDNTLSIIKKYRKIFLEDGISFGWTQHLNNIGARANTKFVFKQISKKDYKYHFHIEGDDYLKEDFFKKSISFLEQNQDFSAVCSDVQMIFEDGSKTIEKYWEERSPYPMDIPLSYSFLQKDNRVFTCTFLCKSDVYKWAADFDLLDKLGVLLGDYMIYLRVANKYKIGYIDKPLATYRNRSDSESHRISHQELIKATNYVKILAEQRVGLD